MKTLKVYTDFDENMEMLTREEIGDLFLAMLAYARDGKETDLEGSARVLWPTARKLIDLQRESYDNKVSGAEKARNSDSKANQNKKFDIKGNQETKSDTSTNHRKTACLDITSTQDKDKDKEKIKINTLNPPLSPLGGNDDLERALKDFIEHRKKLRKPMTPHALDLIRRDLEKLAPGDVKKQIEILEQSIKNGWQGVFELKKPPRAVDYIQSKYSDDELLGMAVDLDG